MHVSAHWLAVWAWRRGDRHCRVLIFVFIGFSLAFTTFALAFGRCAPSAGVGVSVGGIRGGCKFWCWWLR